jgi:hypothetical protein
LHLRFLKKFRYPGRCQAEAFSDQLVRQSLAAQFSGSLDTLLVDLFPVAFASQCFSCVVMPAFAIYSESRRPACMPLQELRLDRSERSIDTETAAAQGSPRS